jgi:hypothetical protein
MSAHVSTYPAPNTSSEEVKDSLYGLHAAPSTRRHTPRYAWQNTPRHTPIHARCVELRRMLSLRRRRQPPTAHDSLRVHEVIEDGLGDDQ